MRKRDQGAMDKMELIRSMVWFGWLPQRVPCLQGKISCPISTTLTNDT